MVNVYWIFISLINRQICILNKHQKKIKWKDKKSNDTSISNGKDQENGAT